jgi:hypothetical protein
MTDTKEVAVKLLKAISLPDSEVFPDLQSKVHNHRLLRMACHILFECQQCYLFT